MKAWWVKMKKNNDRIGDLLYEYITVRSSRVD